MFTLGITRLCHKMCHIVKNWLISGYSYRRASAGDTRAAADDGYSVASSEIPIDAAATITPCTARGAKGRVSME